MSGRGPSAERSTPATGERECGQLQGEGACRPGENGARWQVFLRVSGSPEPPLRTQDSSSRVTLLTSFQCVPPHLSVSRTIFLGSAAIPKHHRPGGRGVFNNENPCSHGPGGWKSAIQMLARSVSFRALFCRPGDGRRDGQRGETLRYLFLVPLWGPHPHELL